MGLPVDNDEAWAEWRRQWTFRPGITYLNHGSFGPPPERVREAQRDWQQSLAGQPMDFYVREFEPHLDLARARLAKFVGTSRDNLILIENATYGMNVVAASVNLRPGDEIVLTDHEYGAVLRVWERACVERGARIVTATLPVLDARPHALHARPHALRGDAMPVESRDPIVDAIMAAVTERTKLLVFSHITSQTALVLPAQAICRAARDRGVATCIDGPHAVATLDLDLDGLDCDYYTASCHKWLSAPFGSGFMYVHPRAQAVIRPPILSWGRVGPEKPRRWDEEFNWLGTRDPSAYLTVPTAIDFLTDVGLDAYRRRCRYLVDYARRKVESHTPLAPLTASEPYVSMLAFPLPRGDARSLQLALRQRYGIEAPIAEWQGRPLLRVSCHLYNRQSDLDHLATALGELLG